MTLLPYDAKMLKPLCEELDHWRAQLEYRGPLPRAWAGRLRRELEAEAVAASTSMEGVPVTVDEVRRILAGESPTEVRPRIRRWSRDTARPWSSFCVEPMTLPSSGRAR